MSPVELWTADLFTEAPMPQAWINVRDPLKVLYMGYMGIL